MQDKIRKIIREILTEEYYVQLAVKEMAKVVVDDLMKFLTNLFNNPIENIQQHYSITLKNKGHLKSATGINLSNISLVLIDSDTFKIEGSYQNGKLFVNADGSYNIFVELSLSLNENIINSIKNRIESALAHEFHHAFVDIKKLQSKKVSKTKIINKVNRYTNVELSKITEKYPILKEFYEMIYFSLPEEVNARVQEISTELDNINLNDTNEILKYLLRFGPMNDIKRMIKYKTDELLKVDKDILTQYVNTFNNHILFFLKINNLPDQYIKVIPNVNSFFKYWVKFLQNNGIELLKTIVKLVCKKTNKPYQQVFSDFLDDYKLLEYVTGYFGDSFFVERGNVDLILENL